MPTVDDLIRECGDLRWVYLFCAVLLASCLLATVGGWQREAE